ncbi:hypothetical protein OAS86_01655 [Gammaproteobacteria bacterium]|nr:hypothetical protein [Gammaproteobacteria bacterium]
MFNLALDLIDLSGQIIQRIIIGFVAQHFSQLATRVNIAADAAKDSADLRQLRALLTELLRFLRIIPDVGRF